MNKTLFSFEEVTQIASDLRKHAGNLAGVNGTAMYVALEAIRNDHPATLRYLEAAGINFFAMGAASQNFGLFLASMAAEANAMGVLNYLREQGGEVVTRYIASLMNDRDSLRNNQNLGMLVADWEKKAILLAAA